MRHWRLGFLALVLTSLATREETGHPLRLRLRDGPSSGLWSLQNTVLNRSQAQSIQWIDCWPAVNHVRREAPIRNPLRFASPGALARNKKTLSPREPNNPLCAPRPSRPPHATLSFIGRAKNKAKSHLSRYIPITTAHPAELASFRKAI